jgi:hypothetical protein
MATSSDVPGYSAEKYSAERGSTGYSGVRDGGSDPTNEPGQYPPGTDHGIFGGPLPTGTGAPGTAGASGSADPTNEPGQTQDGLTGISESDITRTGAPGTQGAVPDLGNGGTQVTFTRPGSYLSGSYASDTVGDDTAGPGDWTQANDDGYASGGPQLPGIKGNEPQAGSGRFQPGSGRVLRGGRAVRG